MNARAPIELQADALVDEIERQVALRERELLDAAAAEAAAIRLRARQKARRQLQRAVEDMRTTGQQRLRQLHATLETARRRRAARHALDALALVWPRLDQAIEQRWNEPRTRSVWMSAQLALARSRWPAQAWVLRHPAAWRDDEVAALRAALRTHAPGEVTLLADASLHAGLVVEVDGARLDSTPRALLADRARVESALLAALLRAEETPP